MFMAETAQIFGLKFAKHFLTNITTKKLDLNLPIYKGSKNKIGGKKKDHGHLPFHVAFSEW